MKFEFNFIYIRKFYKAMFLKLFFEKRIQYISAKSSLLYQKN
jgi:hypothetical protein